MRQFSRGPNVMFEYRPGMAIGDLGGTYSRAGEATQTDKQGNIRRVLPGVIRDNHFINGVGPFLLREIASTNLLLRSDIQGAIGTLPTSFSNFALANTNLVSDDIPSVALDYSGLVAKHTRDTTSADSNCGGQGFTAAANTVYAVSAYLWVPASFTGTSVQLRSEGSGLSVTGSVDVDLTKRDQWQRVFCLATGSATGGSASALLRIVAVTGQFIYSTCWQVEAMVAVSGVSFNTPTSWIKTDAVAVTRNKDLISFEWGYAPQHQTAYVKAVALFNPGTPVSRRVWQISSANDNGPRFLLYFPTALGSTFFQESSGGPFVSANPSGNVVFGSTFEVRSTINADASVTATKSINGGAETTSSSGTILFPEVWGNAGSPRLSLGSDGGGNQEGCYAYEVIRFVKGTKTLSEMRQDYFAAITADRSEIVHLLEFDFSDGLVRLNTGAQDLKTQQYDSITGLWTQSGVTLSGSIRLVSNEDTSTVAWHTDSAVAGAYLQVDMGRAAEFSRCRIWAAAAGHAGNYTIRGSQNAITWTDVSTGFIPGLIGENTKLFTAARYRFWRIELANTPGASADLTEVRFDQGGDPVWEAVGGLLELGGYEETTDARGQGIDLKLSGVDQSLMSVLFNSKYRGRPVKIYRAHLNSDTGQLVSDPLLLVRGLQLNPYQIEEERDRSGGTVRISTRIVGYLGVERIRGIQSNAISHAHHFTGETFFQHTSSLTNRKIFWGMANTSTSRGGTLTDGDRGRGGGRDERKRRA